MAILPKDLYYAESHEWLKKDGDAYYFGITDYAQSELGDIVYVEAEPEGTELEAGDIIGNIESVKSASDLYAPIAVEILEVNEALEDEPELINQDAYENWIAKVRVVDEAELDNLMDAAGYEAMIE